MSWNITLTRALVLWKYRLLNQRRLLWLDKVKIYAPNTQRVASKTTRGTCFNQCGLAHTVRVIIVEINEHMSSMVINKKTKP